MSNVSSTTVNLAMSRTLCGLYQPFHGNMSIKNSGFYGLTCFAKLLFLVVGAFFQLPDYLQKMRCEHDQIKVRSYSYPNVNSFFVQGESYIRNYGRYVSGPRLSTSLVFFHVIIDVKIIISIVRQCRVRVCE